MKRETMLTDKRTRNSSIELLKVVGMFLIVICHVISSLIYPNENVGGQDYVINISRATTNIQHLILAMLSSGGAIGNTIFFVCSAWFLLDSKRASKKKVFQMILDIWLVSVIILIVVLFLKKGHLERGMIVKQFIPTTLGSNWYMTCYLLFYPIHPFLNWIISKMKKETLFRASLILSFLYLGINYIQKGPFFTSPLVLWVVLYFIIGYMKYYLVDISNSIKINVILVCIGLIGINGVVLLTNFVGLRTGVFSKDLLTWTTTNNNPFAVMIAIGMLNITRNFHFSSRAINYISKLSLFIYIIHENVLLRTYYRPKLWQWVYANAGYSHVLGWAIILAVLVFAFGAVASVIYKNTVQRVAVKFVDFVYPVICCGYSKIEYKIFKIH